MSKRLTPKSEFRETFSRKDQTVCDLSSSLRRKIPRLSVTTDFQQLRPEPNGTHYFLQYQRFFSLSQQGKQSRSFYFPRPHKDYIFFRDCRQYSSRVADFHSSSSTCLFSAPSGRRVYTRTATSPPTSYLR